MTQKFNGKRPDLILDSPDDENYDAVIANKFDTLMDEISAKAKKQGQGSCTIHEDFFESLQVLFPHLKSVSANYYDCDGRQAFALKISPFITIDGISYAGISFGAPARHLSKYYNLRW